MPNPGFLDTQTQYENLEIFDLTSSINSLKSALLASEPSETTINTAFSPIADYYTKLTTINKSLQNYIANASNTIVDSSPSKERYSNKIRPEESVLAREPTRGLMPELRVKTLPYLLAISVFMASLTIFLIFQMFGFSGQINLPISITSFLSSPASPIPFYMNPLFLGGFIVILLVAVIIFAVLYFNSKNTNNE
jgi:hypothetical protein